MTPYEIAKTSQDHKNVSLVLNHYTNFLTNVHLNYFLQTKNYEISYFSNF